ncbi:hypothetical protein ACSDR0_36025 [Streptosporangium sp. G11]|uniref:hypothetical protein n=1 Tax=Streptosporangium sp. G11 TaxID=3436926 RepID=UPI003EBF03F1
MGHHRERGGEVRAGGVDPRATGVRPPDALHRLIRGHLGPTVPGHRLFQQDDTDTAHARRAWLNGLPA